MTAPIRIAFEQQLPVSVRDGFDYITDPVNWREYWPRLVRVDSATRWREPGDRACVVQRILGREVELDMTLVRTEPYRLVEYTSKQRGLPDARHRRHFDQTATSSPTGPRSSTGRDPDGGVSLTGSWCAAPSSARSARRSPT